MSATPLTESSGFKDHFSGHAQAYAAHRPGYPRALFEWLASIAPDREVGWDCGTGNGQAAVALAEFFERVEATDASAQQIAAAQEHERVHYRAAPAEESGLDDSSISLVTVAQAVHWFDLPRFWREVRRVCKPGGVAVVWCYGLTQISDGIDAVVMRLYRDIVGPYWPAGRKQVETGYRDLAFPLDELKVPPFAMTLTLSCEDFIGYLRTWSAVQRYLKDQGTDPLNVVTDDLGRLWGDGKRAVSWPLAFRAGRV